MSAILRWFNDGDVRYRAYFRTHESNPGVRQLVVASRHGECAQDVPADCALEDFSHSELLNLACRVRVEMQERAELVAVDAAAD